MKFIALLAVVGLASAAELADPVIPHHPAAAPHHVKSASMSSYQWSLYDVDSQLEMYRESEYKKN